MIAAPTAAPPRDSARGEIEELALVADWIARLFLARLEQPALDALRRSSGLVEIGERLACQGTARRMHDLLSVEPAASTARALAQRYTALFDGVAGARTVPLCESAYCGAAPRLFQQPFAEMRQILRDLDLSVREECPEPADHVSVEVAALAAALRDDQRAIAAALRTRLEGWVPKLRARLEQQDRSGFYSGAATLVAALLETLGTNAPAFARAGAVHPQ